MNMQKPTTTSNLQTLDLTGCNQITHEAKNELKQLLPQLGIIG